MNAYEECFGLANGSTVFSDCILLVVVGDEEAEVVGGVG